MARSVRACRTVDTAQVPAEDSLKRLGAGRWETRDGRFAIEPQSGTWVVVDNTQTDELGLPLVRGPFGSLTAAREAIESARNTGPAESPLAGRIKQARESVGGKAREGVGDKPTPGDRGRVAKEMANRTAASRLAAAQAAGSEEATDLAATEPPPPPPEPRWLRELTPADRRRARELIERLDRLAVAEPEEIARAEIARDQPALARVGLERMLRDAIASSKGPRDAGQAVVDAIMRGKDDELGVRWRLVDDRGRRIDELEITD